jgi:hypothetical protein
MKGDHPMNTKLIGITVAFAVTITGAVLAATAGAAAAGSNRPSARDPNVYAMRMDGCPYYPSPVACHSGAGARTTSDGAAQAQAAVDAAGGKIA